MRSKVLQYCIGSTGAGLDAAMQLQSSSVLQWWHLQFVKEENICRTVKMPAEKGVLSHSERKLIDFINVGECTTFYFLTDVSWLPVLQTDTEIWVLNLTSASGQLYTNHRCDGKWVASRTIQIKFLLTPAKTLGGERCLRRRQGWG